MPLDDVFAEELRKQQERDANINTSALDSFNVNPDQHAGNLKLARKAGVPAALMPEISDDARLKILLDKVGVVSKTSPATARFITDPDNLKATHDDLDNMSALEKTFSVLANSVRSLASSPWGVSSGLWGNLRALGDVDAAITRPLDYLIEKATGKNLSPGLAIAQHAQEMQQGAEATAEGIKGDTSGAGLAERGLYSGVESLGQNLLNLPLTILSGGSVVPMLAGMGLSTGGRGYGQARDKDVGILPALSFGASQGAIEVATEMIPALTFVKNLKAKSSFMKFGREMFATEVPGEQAATAMQDLNEWAVLNPDKPFSDYVKERPAAAIETLIATVVGTGGMVVTAKGLERVGASVDKFQTANFNRDFLLALGDGVQATKLRERLPEKMQDLIKEMRAQHGTPEHVYVPADKLTELWQSAGLDPQAKAAEMLSNPEEYFQALATGSDVAIPLDEFATRFTGEEYYKALVEDVRLGAGASTMREADEWSKSGKDQALSDLLAEAEGLAPTQSDAKVYDDVLGQLIGTGMERQTAERNAQVMKAVFRTLGARSGQDPFALYQRYGLKIDRPLPEALSKRLSVDMAIDPLLDRLRAGDIPTDSKVRGRSLVEMLREKGIQDTSGELKSLEPDAGKGKKLIRKKGLEMDRALTTAIEQGYLPEGSDLTDFLDAIREDLAGRPVYSAQNFNESLLGDQLSMQQMKEYLDAHDIDIQGMTNEEIRQTLQAAMSPVGGREMNQALPEKMEIDGVERWTVNSNGQPIARTEEGIRNFWKWFGESKVVDADGKPQVVYHGTDKTFTKINLKKGAQGLFWFTSDKAGIESGDVGASGKGKIMELYAKIESPADWGQYDKLGLYEFKSRGLDGAILNDEDGTFTGFVMRKDENQIKSASGKNNAFDPNDPNILHQGSAEGHEALSVRKTQAEGMLLTAVLQDGKVKVAGIGATHYDVHKDMAVKGSEGLEDANGFVTPSGEFLDRMAALSWLKENRPDVYKQLDKVTKKNGLESQDYAHAEGVTSDTDKAMNDYFARQFGATPGMLFQSGRGQAWDIPQQKVSSASTSISYPDPEKKSPIIFSAYRNGKIELGPVNADIGGGRFDQITEWLKGKDVTNIVWDKFNRDAEHNRAAEDQLRGGQADTATISNVLNVIAEPEARAAVIATAQDALKVGGKAFFSMYTAPKPGEVKGRDAFQTGLKTTDYISEIEAVFGKGSVERKGDILIATKGADTVLNQKQADTKRAFIRFGEDRIFNIGFLENADLSSFVHESSHFYFEILGDLAEQENASQQIVDDYKTLLKYVGAENRAAITTEQHEVIARSFEAYIMEGKAPSLELQSTFSRMKAWLVSIYKEIRKLNVKINDDVRQVFDRLVASDEEIEAARERSAMKEIFTNAADMGVSEAEFEIYRKLGEKAHAAQVEKLEREYMAELERQRRQWWRDESAKMAEEIDRETQEEPVYIAIQVLTKGVTFSGAEIPVKLDRKTLEKQYGKSLVKRLPRGIFSKEGGVSADQVAELVGFESGADLIEAMIVTPSRKEYIKDEADRRMRARHGDMLTDGTAADEAALAVHSDDQGAIFYEELRAMKKLQRDAEKISRAKEGEDRAVRTQAIGAIPPASFFKNLARDMVARKTIEELLPYRYQQAAAKASREAFEAAQKKDWTKAAEAKQRQLLNHYLYKEAASVKKMVDKQVGKWLDLIKKSDKRLAASRDMNVVTAARAILAQYGIGQSADKALAALHQVQVYDPNLYESLQMAVDVATQEPKPYKTLNLVEFIGLMDAVNNLWHLSRRSKIAMIDGLAVGLEEIQDELGAQLGAQGAPFAGMGDKSAVTDLQKIKIGFLGMGAALKRVEHWVTEMDRGDSGPFRRFILQPIYDAIVDYKTAKKPVIEQLKNIVANIDPSVFEGNLYHEIVSLNINEKAKHILSMLATSKQIPAPEIGYTFKNKGELLHAILHTGNESNLKKLLVGRGWATADENGLDKTEWDNFLKRMYEGPNPVLTEADYVFCQQIWDLLESQKAAAQKAHHDMYGYYFAEVTAAPVTTPFGIYRGGYVPAITDPYIVESAADRADQENLLQDNASSMFPATTGKGFTMSRVAGYNKSLLLDLGLLATHVDKVLRFSYMGPAIQDVGRILNNADLKERFREINPAWSSEMLIPWLKRIARQSVEKKSSGWGGKMVDSIFRGLRRRTGLQLMAANIGNAAQQLTGLLPAMVKVEPRRVGSALLQFGKHPAELTATITEKSPWMRDRLDNEIGNLSGELRELLIQSKYEKAQDYGMRAGYFLSGAAQHIVDVIVWQGAYDQAIKEGEDEKTAVKHADSMVRQTQGSFSPEDASSFEAGSPFTRLFTQFYAYFNMIANLSISESRNAVADLGWKGGSPRLFYIYAMAFALPSFLSEVIMSAMRGKVDDDDDGEYIDDILRMFLTGQGRAATALIPGVGQVINAAVGKFTKLSYDDKMSVSPAVGSIEGSVGVGKDLYDVLLDGKELKRAHVRDVFTLLGMVTGLPAAALARPIGYAVAAESGATEPANTADYIRGLMTGYAPKP